MGWYSDNGVKVLVMCATRNRPQSVNRMIDSVLSTSTKADVAVYVDEDQVQLYRGIDPRAKTVVGERHGQCVSLSSLCHGFPGYVAYGAATDDCTFVTPGWDDWVIETAQSFKGQIGAIAPRCEMDRRMDFPWFTSRWIEIAGRFCPLGTEHFFWDVALEVVGEQTQIAYATKDQFQIEHADEQPLEIAEDRHDMKTAPGLRTFNVHQDARFACAWLASERQGLIAKLREAMCQ